MQQPREAQLSLFSISPQDSSWFSSDTQRRTLGPPRSGELAWGAQHQPGECPFPSNPGQPLPLALCERPPCMTALPRVCPPPFGSPPPLLSHQPHLAEGMSVSRNPKPPARSISWASSHLRPKLLQTRLEGPYRLPGNPSLPPAPATAESHRFVAPWRQTSATAAPIMTQQPPALARHCHPGLRACGLQTGTGPGPTCLCTWRDPHSPPQCCNAAPAGLSWGPRGDARDIQSHDRGQSDARNVTPVQQRWESPPDQRKREASRNNAHNKEHNSARG